MTTLDSLRQAFLDDHRTLTHGLHDLLNTVEAGDWRSARSQAEDLDKAVGPHMAFEEEVYYPQLRRVLGSEFVDKLYHEHAEGVEAVRTLIGQSAETPLNQTDRNRVIEQLGLALEHAKSCGTLLSHLKGLSPNEHAEMFQRLQAMRRTPLRWTDVASRAPAR